MACESEKFIEQLKDYGHSMYVKGELVGLNKTRGKPFSKACAESDRLKQEFIESWSPECHCDLEKISKEFEELVKKYSS